MTSIPKDPREAYRENISRFAAGLESYQRGLRWLPWLRLLLFLLSGFVLWLIFYTGPVFILPFAVIFGLFLTAGWYDLRLKTKSEHLRALVRINEAELQALEGDHSAFDPGTEFIRSDHPYASDLDVFGEHSLFRVLNRCATWYGRQTLNHWLSDAFRLSPAIGERQSAVRELADHTGFRQQLLLIFGKNATSSADKEALEQWLAQPPALPSAFIRGLILVIPFITLITILLAAFGMVPFQVPVTLILMQLLVVFGFSRKMMMIHQDVTAQAGILRKYAEALTLLESLDCKSACNRAWQDRLKSVDGKKPGDVIRDLSTKLNLMDSNLNMLVSVILNGLFMFSLHVMLSAERWRSRYRSLVPQWFEVLGQVDALSGIATFAFNHPGYSFPETHEGGFILEAEAIGHPLIPEESCVRNDISIHGWNQFRIITGANMSGKSTFLRTIGTNLVLGMIGAPVFAKKLVFTPVEIHSSIRTSDSLARRESYFYAELRRLREIISELQQGRQKLVLLDEILKGTNSADKQAGSAALIRHLMKYKIVGLFATHDLALGQLAAEFPENLENLCFEISINGESMEIDYILRKGICSNLNASFLMKRMGIILE